MSYTKESLMPANIGKCIKALRFGEYEQATHKLQVKNTFCCLGVFCKVAEKEGIKPVYSFERTILFGNSLAAQRSIAAFLGLKNNPLGKFDPEEVTFPRYIKRNPVNSLVKLNDYEKWSFKMIADFIELNWFHILNYSDY